MTFRSKFKRLARRILPASAPPPAPATPPRENPFIKMDLDWDRLAREAPTRFERIYYGQRGRFALKWAHYLPLYDRVLSPFVGQPITLVEIGVASGGSLALWREYLGPQIRILAIDLNETCKAFEEPGVEIMIGDQGDPAFMRQVAEAVGTAEVVIDDGSHICAHQILAFETLFPLVKTGGVYICEDLHTSYWETFGGGLGKGDTFIGYVKAMIDRLHSQYYGHDRAPDDLSCTVGPMLVADSMVAFDKVEPVGDAYMAWVERRGGG